MAAMTNNTQLPDEVLLQVEKDAVAVYEELYVKVLNHGDGFAMPKFNIITSPIEKILTEYAKKLHQADQEIAQLKQWKKEATELLNPILEYGQSKEAGIPLGGNITSVVLERCKQVDTARTLLTEVLVMNEMWGDLPGEFINKVKTFLDGTK
jgi:hypothetical protein